MHAYILYVIIFFIKTIADAINKYRYRIKYYNDATESCD